MRKKTLLGCLMLLYAVQAVAGGRPVIGDAWVYTTTFRVLDNPSENVTTNILFTEVAYLNTMGKPVFKGDMSLGMSSGTCLFDIAAGEELAGEIPCEEPLPIGTSWHAALKDPNKGSEQSLAVIGVEEVQLASRSYLATVIQTERALTPFDSAGGPGITHRRATYWYVPDLKGMAKIEHVLMDDRGNKLTRESFTLLKFFPAIERANK